MEVPHAEELATHSGPESCAGGSNATGEALTGGVWAWLLSRERQITQSADDVRGTEGNTGRVAKARTGRALRGPLEPGTYTNFLHENREIPQPTGRDVDPVRTENPKGQCCDVR